MPLASEGEGVQLSESWALGQILDASGEHSSCDCSNQDPVAQSRHGTVRRAPWRPYAPADLGTHPN